MLTETFKDVDLCLVPIDESRPLMTEGSYLVQCKNIGVASCCFWFVFAFFKIFFFIFYCLFLC